MDGLEILRIVDGQGPVTIDRVEVLGTDALEAVGIQLAGPERELGGVQFFAAFPPQDDLDPEGVRQLALLEPIDTDAPFVVVDEPYGTSLLLGLRATSIGRHERSGIRVVYSRGGVQRQQDFPAELVVCVQDTVGPLDTCE